ncbi:MAG: D-2-hydroxyacid dehydrogenase [Alkalimonas sp.]|nr:D-2-hydroxyacid dehydrogenase [Alkalimonas sp.]
MALPHAVFLDAGSVGDADLSPLHQLAIELTLFAETKPSQVLARLQDATIAIVNKTELTAEVMQQLPQLKYIAVTATGLNNIDVAAARQAGIWVQNVQHYATASVAQHVFALLLQLTNQCQAYQQAIRDGRWSQSAHFCLLDYPMIELAGKTLCIIGYGTLGQATAQLAKAFGMQVIIAERPGIACRPNRVAFDKALTMADVISLHCPLTQQNHHLISSAQLRLMKPTAIVINTARGALIDTQALLDALRSETLYAAALDVLDTEPPPADHPALLKPHPRLLLSPHVAWATAEARARLIQQVARDLSQWLSAQSI